MAYFSETQFVALMNAIQMQAATGVPVRPRTDDNRKTIDPRHLHLKEFDGDPSKWTEWAFSFRRTIRSANTKVFDLFDKIETADITINEGLMHDELQNEIDIHKLSGELYDILSQYCTNEALTVIRSVETCQGFVAWQKLYMKFNPKTMARAISMSINSTQS